jgi:aspartyl-tRNA(Asn)/glutamyl-tRNA(Gln) amidotransferase subunit A
MTELTDAGVGRLLELYRARETSPVEVVEACLHRIESVDRQVNAVVTLCAESALRSAEESAQRWLRGRAGPLEGIPFGLKDVIATAGIRTTGGSAVYRDYVPSNDATVVRRLAEAGGVLVAKLQTFSFALGGPANDDFGVTRNPWDLERSAGGSSSGPAACLAARMLPLTIGSDTGGSIRLPAAFCGVTGLRPTYGRVPSEGVMLLTWTLDTVGPMTRSAADCALVLPAITADRTRASEHRSASPERDLRGLRIGIPRNWFFDVCDPEVAAAVHGVAEAMSGLGAETVEIELPHAHLADAIGRTIVTVEAASLHEATLDDRIEEYHGGFAERLLAAQFISALDYVRSLRLRRLVCEDFDAAFAVVDAIVTPTSAVAAPLLADETCDLGDRTVPWRELATRTTFPFSLASLPAVSTHAGLTSRGLPIGVQIAAPSCEDELCLRIAAAYEDSSGHGQAAPTLPPG